LQISGPVASCPGRETQQACAALGTAACPAALVAWLLVILATSHLFLDAGMFDELSEPFHRIRNRFMLSQTQFDHKVLLLVISFDIGSLRLHPCVSIHAKATESGPQQRRPVKITPISHASGCGPDGCGGRENGAGLPHLVWQHSKFGNPCKQTAAPKPPEDSRRSTNGTSALKQRPFLGTFLAFLGC